jgi:hypothetical protein
VPSRHTASKTYITYRVLMPPDVTHYCYGHFAYSKVPFLADVPIIWFQGHPVAILDCRCVVESTQDGSTTYAPAEGDLSWLADHPSFNGQLAALARRWTA